MTGEQAITAITRVAAEVCGVGDIVGSLEEGKQADILVVRGDPLADPSAIAEVEAVYVGGQQIQLAGVPSGATAMATETPIS